MCGAEVLTMVGVFVFPALLPQFVAEWQITNTQAGWIAGIVFGGYAVSVPILVSLTDRIDARLIYMGGATLAALALVGFVMFAGGFWSAMAWRFLAGIALAATYMPGLRALVDRYPGNKQGRAVSFYTASFSLGTAFSFFLSGEIGDAFGWEVAVWFAAATSLTAVFVAFLVLRPVTPHRPEGPETHVFDFRPVFRNRAVMGFVLAYCAHSWELFALRSWAVAFLVFSIGLQTVPIPVWLTPTTVVTVSALAAVVGSIFGNEIAERYGRRRMIAVFATLSGMMALVIGFLPALAYGLVASLVIIYATFIQLDSATLTAGTIAASERGRRGATLGVHALIGFSGGAVGPLVTGVVLDASGGGTSVASWGAGFAAIGVAALMAPVALYIFRSKET